MEPDWQEGLKKIFPQARLNEPLVRYTTFKIGGPAEAYLEINNRLELETLMRFISRSNIPVLFIGWGSNLLILDGGIPGVVAALKGDFEKIDFLEKGLVRVGAGVRIPQFVSVAANHGLGGAESLVGIPGTLGGAVMMNAGTRELEIGALIQDVEIFDPKTFKSQFIDSSQVNFSYRFSGLSGRVILSALLRLREGDKVDIMKRIAVHQSKRLKTQPVHTFNVGSIFKNPDGFFAADLIEKAGFKGIESGGARVSPLHANFIENFNNAKAADVLDLVETIRKKIKKDAGVELELEIKIVGRSL